MKVRVDGELCSGHGRCYAVAPNVYAPDDEGYNAARNEEIEVPEGLEDDARSGQRNCPEHAIRVEQ